MLSVEALRQHGAAVDEGLGRCFGNEEFYLRMVGMALDDKGFERLRTQIEAGDLDSAFETAHALKGVLANLSLTPILDPVVEITELLRARTQTDYGPLLETIENRHAEIMAMQ